MIHSLADVGRVLEPGARLEPSKAPPCALLPPAQPHHRKTPHPPRDSAISFGSKRSSH